MDPNGWYYLSPSFPIYTYNYIRHAGLYSRVITYHLYTKGKVDYTLKYASAAPEKADSIVKSGTKFVWPNEEDLEEWQDSPIAYSHVKDPSVEDESAA